MMRMWAAACTGQGSGFGVQLPEGSHGRECYRLPGSVEAGFAENGALQGGCRVGPEAHEADGCPQEEGDREVSTDPLQTLNPFPGLKVCPRNVICCVDSLSG